MIASRPAKYPILASAHAVVSDTESRMGSSLGDSMETKQAAKIRLFSRTLVKGKRSPVGASRRQILVAWGQLRPMRIVDAGSVAGRAS